MRPHRFLLIFIAAAAIACCMASPAFAIQDVNIAVSVVTPSTATLVVKTDTTSDVTVDYGSSPGVYLQSRSGTGLNRHEILLDGLTPSTTVYYRVTMTASGNPADTLVLAEQSFSTIKASGVPFSYAVIGDNRPAPNSPIVQPPVFTTIVNQMAAENLDLVLHAGDIVESAWDESLALNESKYDAFFSVTKALTMSLPMYTAVGNHEGIVYANNRAGYEREFTLPINNGASAATDGEEYYSFDNGDTHFIVLCSEFAGNIGFVRGDQLTWLQQDLQTHASAWTVILLHRPFFTGTHTTEPWLNPAHVAGQANKAELLSQFQLYGVDVVFEGHDHYYQHHIDSGIHFVISGGAGSPLYGLPVFGAGDIYGASVNHHVKVDETHVSMMVTAIDSTGSQLESFTLGDPSLTLSQGSVYWGSYADYLAGLLSVDFVMGDSGPGDAQNVQMVYLAASNGVMPATATPISLGDLQVGQSANATVQYLVPPGVAFFRSTTYATCSSLAGIPFAFPGPPPAF